jgi:lipid-A-disaccharide synthase-like uncharacterized protein
MGELLLAYALMRLLAAPMFPRDSDGFMPFQEHYLLWKCIGFAGIATFGTRFVVQWLYSEKHGESKVPVIFWWQSLIGTVLCLAYFLRQQDSVGIAGYVLNVIPYSRNLVLVYRKRRETAIAPTAAAAAP